MAHIVQLTAAQQADVVKLKGALTSDQASVRAAQNALNTHLASLVPVKKVGKIGGVIPAFGVRQTIAVSDDGTALIVG